MTYDVMWSRDVRSPAVANKADRIAYVALITRVPGTIGFH